MSHTIESVEAAFADQPTIRAGIYEALRDRPQSARLFDDIGRYILSIAPKSQNLSDAPDHPSKKRKLNEPIANGGHQHSSSLRDAPRRLILEARDISFSLPQRKKLHLGIVHYGSSLEDKDSVFAIQARNPATNQVEFEYPISSFVHTLRLPVPEKVQKQYNFCLLPAKEKIDSVEPIIWTVNSGPLKSCKIEDPRLAQIAAGPDDVLESAIGYIFERTGNKLILPSDKEFASALRESHRKSDVAYHVKAFKGSKEGYLFFLETGIFFGFKKPLILFAFDDIESVSYGSILQRTFNMTITIRSAADEAAQEIEYSMLDQVDFPGIDAYVKKHQLQDASLAEARRARGTKVNGTKSTDGTAGDEDDDRTELQKAEAELDDEEDEFEEDYDPDEEESDGSGSDSDDEEYRQGKGRNLVAEELGSEAEEVSASEDEDGDDDEDDADGDGDENREEEVKDEVVARNPPKTIRYDPRGPELDDDDQL